MLVLWWPFVGNTIPSSYLSSNMPCEFWSLPQLPQEGASTFVASVKESMRTAVRFPTAADLRDLGKSLASTVLCTWTLNGVYSNGRAVVKDLTRTRSRPNDCFIQPECLYVYALSPPLQHPSDVPVWSLMVSESFSLL